MPFLHYFVPWPFLGGRKITGTDGSTVSLSISLSLPLAPSPSGAEIWTRQFRMRERGRERDGERERHPRKREGAARRDGGRDAPSKQTTRLTPGCTMQMEDKTRVWGKIQYEEPPRTESLLEAADINDIQKKWEHQCLMRGPWIAQC